MVVVMITFEGFVGVCFNCAWIDSDVRICSFQP